MRSFSMAVAERLFRLVTTEARAISIAGDLVEVEWRKGPLRFWTSSIRLFVALAWRSLLAFVAAFFLGAWVWNGMQTVIYGVHAHHPPEYPWMPFFSVLSGIAVILWISASDAAIRYGARDKMTRLSTGLALLVTLFLCEWWRPGIPAVCGVVFIIAAISYIYRREYQKPFAGLVATIIIGSASIYSALYLQNRIVHFIHPGPMGGADWQAHTSLQWVVLGTYLTIVCSCVRTFTAMHKWAGTRDELRGQAS